eukprot:403340873
MNYYNRRGVGGNQKPYENTLNSIDQLDRLANLDVKNLKIEDLLDDKKLNQILGGGNQQPQNQNYNPFLDYNNSNQLGPSAPLSQRNRDNNNVQSLQKGPSYLKQNLVNDYESQKPLLYQRKEQTYEQKKLNTANLQQNEGILQPQVMPRQSRKQDGDEFNTQQNSLQQSKYNSKPVKFEGVPDALNLKSNDRTPINNNPSQNQPEVVQMQLPAFDENGMQKPVFFLGADFDEHDPNFDPNVQEDLIDEETLKKIEEFKQKFLNMKKKAEEAEQDLAYSSIKVEELVSKIKDLEGKKNEFKDELVNETRQGAALRRKLADLEDDKISLEQQLESGFKPNKFTKLKEVNLAKHKQLMEEKARREREEMKRQVLIGIDLQDKKMTQKFLLLLKKSNYDKSIEGFFLFFKFLVNISFFVLALFMIIILRHVFNYKYDFTSFCSTGIFKMPCFTFYSRFHTDDEFYYSLTLELFIIIGIFMSLYKWVQFDLLKKERSLYEDQKKKFSKIFFNMWDWSTNNSYESYQLKNALRMEIKLNIDEDKIKETIKQRKSLEKTKLFIRRILTFILNTLILLCGWGLILLVNIYQSDIQNYFESFSILKYVSTFVATLCLSIINVAVPHLIKSITQLEAWDFQDQLIKQQVWRMYLAKIMNFAIFVFIELELILGKRWFNNITLVTFNENGQNFDCKEDQVAIQIFKLLITELAIKLVIPFLKALGERFFFGLMKGRKQWQPEYLLSDDIVWLLYFQAIVWVTLILYPFITVVIPMILFVLFKHHYFVLRNFKSKPKKSSNANDTGFFIMIFLNITFFSVSALILLFMSQSLDHETWLTNSQINCGPYPDLHSGQYSIEEQIQRSEAASYIYYIEYQLQIEELQKSITKLQRKIDYNKMAQL